jgi:hypothetical protein
LIKHIKWGGTTLHKRVVNTAPVARREVETSSLVGPSCIVGFWRASQHEIESGTGGSVPEERWSDVKAGVVIVRRRLKRLHAEWLGFPESTWRCHGGG